MQLLHWVFKAGNLRKNVDFFNGLGMQIIRHEEFDSGCEAQCNGAYSRPWSKTMIGYKHKTDRHDLNVERARFVFELTYNYGIKEYKRGNDFKCALIACSTPQALFDSMLSKGYSCDSEEELTLLSPDGYPFQLVEKNVAEPEVTGVCLNVHRLQEAVDYFHHVVKLSDFGNYGNVCRLGFPDMPRTYIELHAVYEPVNHGTAYGRLAVAIDEVKNDFKSIEQEVKEQGYKIHTPLVTLPTPGKADVQVIILQDLDDYEICIVGERGFFELSQPFAGCDFVDWEKRILNGSQD